MGQNDLLLIGGGALLILSLFLSWFGDVSGWEGQSTTDIYLLITGAVAIAAALNAGPTFPGVSANGAAALLGVVATVLMLWLILFDFPEGVDRGIGIFLALAASAAIAYGGYTAAS
jgi:hypothetical protein